MADKREIGETIINVKDLSLSFGKRKVLNNINLEIKKGEIFGIIGMSGAGKTTILRSLIGYLRPDHGNVMFRPSTLLSLKSASVFEPVSKEQKQVKKVFGFATQNTSFYPSLTIEENLKYFGSLYGLSKDVTKTNINMALELVGLLEYKKIQAAHLSGGMQKRLDIACALIHNPSVLILDEPTADLDVTLRKQMWSLIRKINEKGTTIIIASHFLDELEILCDRIAILHDNRILGVGKVNDLRNVFTKNEEIHLITESKNYDKLIRKLNKGKLGIKKIEEKEGYLAIYAPKAEKLFHYLLHLLEKSNEKLVDIELSRPGLKEVFESLTKKGK